MRKFLRPIPIAVAALIALILYALTGFLLVPYAIKNFVVPAASEELQRPIFVKDVEFNPFQLALRLTEFEIVDKDHTPLLGFDEFYVNFQMISIIRQAYVFDTIRFNIPYFSVKVDRDGRVNLADLVPAEEASPSETSDADKKKEEIPAIEIGQFEIAQGVVEVIDISKPTPFSLDIVPINLVLNNFHTRAGGDNTYSFVAELGKDRTLAWEGRISLEPLRSEGKLTWTGIRIPVLFGYVKDQFKFDILSGTLLAKGQYRFDASVSPIELSLSEASLHLADVTLVDKTDPTPVITVPTLEIDGLDFSLANKTASVQAVRLADAKDRVWRNPNGTINLQTLFAPSETVSAVHADSPKDKSPDAEESHWAVTVKELIVTNHAIQFDDRTLSLPMRVDVTEMSVKSHDLAIPINGTIPLQVDLKLNESGTLSVDGQVSVNPLKIDMDLGVKNVALEPFQPYLEQFARVTINGGSVDLSGEFHFDAEHRKTPLLTFGGNLGVKSLAIASQDRAARVLSWKAVHLQQIAMSVDPTSVAIEEVGLEEPAIHATVLADGQLNLKSLAVKSDEPPPAEKPTSTAKKGSSPAVTVKTVKLLKGAATFQDESIAPAVRIGIHDLTGTIKGLSSKQLARADVDLSGTIEKTAPLKITGAINPLLENAFTDLTFKFDNFDLTAVTPYSGKYAGYPIHKGKLFLDLAYKVSQKALEAENKISVDQLTFGEKVESPDATTLPVPFAVALLKDRNGRIDIDLPIRGDLNDPDFKYGRVLLSTLANLLGKMVASPFSLMGKLVPGGGTGEDLQYIEFDPGSTAMLASEQKKIEILSKGLEERPGLRLEVTGTADPDRDRTALKLEVLKSQLLARWQKDKEGPNVPEMSKADEERILKELYEQRSSQQPPAQNQAQPTQVPTHDEMKKELLAAITVDDGALRTLAQQRADQMRGLFVSSGKVSDKRIFLTNVEVARTGHELVRSRLNVAAGSE